MKKWMFSLGLLLTASVAFSQADSLSLKEYTGKYLFPDGSPVNEIKVVMEKGILQATSAIGNSELKMTENKDVFDLVAYGGLATFSRGEDGKIKTLRIQVDDVDMEGSRDAEPALAWLHRQSVSRSGCSY